MEADPAIPEFEPPRRFLPPLTGLRGIAAVWVLFYHVGGNFYPLKVPIIDMGWVGVDIFFVLSGFILAHVHLNDFTTINTRSIRTFLALRLSRIYPVHFVMLLAVAGYAVALYLVGVPVLKNARFNPVSFFENLLLVQTWGWERHTSFNIAAWSISAEWFAYLVFPLLAFIGRRTSPVAAVVIAASAVACLIVFYEHVHPSANAFTSSFALVRAVPEFIAGFFCYVAFRAGTFDPLRWGSITDAAAIYFIICVFIGNFMLALPAIPVVIWGLASGAGASSQFLSRRSILYLGEVSYSLYMVHLLVIELVLAPFTFTRFQHDLSHGVMALVMMVALLAIAAATLLMHNYVEVPARTWLRRMLGAGGSRKQHSSAAGFQPQ